MGDDTKAVMVMSFLGVSVFTLLGFSMHTTYGAYKKMKRLEREVEEKDKIIASYREAFKLKGPAPELDFRGKTSMISEVRKPRIEEEKLALELAKASFRGVFEDKVRFGPHDLAGNLAAKVEDLREDGWVEFLGLLDKLKAGDKIVRIRFKHEGSSFNGPGIKDWLVIIREGKTDVTLFWPNIPEDDKDGDRWQEWEWEKRKRAKKLKL